MGKQSDQIAYSVRSYITPRIIEHKNLHGFSLSVFQNYCKLTSGLHVLPDFYIIGGQKCGTTSLFMYLIGHPSIHSTAVKDIRFFDKYFEKGISWYKIFFPFTLQKIFSEKIYRRNFLTCDATERYLDHPHAPHRIKEITPNAKFIVLLRNPIDRAYSHYNMINHRENVSSSEYHNSFEDAIKDEGKQMNAKLEQMIKDPVFYDNSYFRHGYVHRGVYIDKLKRWMEVFPKERFFFIQSEEFLKNPSKIYREVIEFLNLPNWEPKEYVQYKKRKYKQPKMNPETRKKLAEYFKPHNERLYEFLGRRFDWDE